MSIASEIDRINGEVNSQSAIIDEITAILDSKAGSNPKLQEKTVTPTKEGLSVVPDGGFDGMSKVTVNGDNNLVPENIKEGVSIFGISGILASTDLIFYKTTSPEFTGIIEKISLTNLPHLPFIIAIVRGSMDTIPSNLWTSDKQCALYGRFDAYGYSYFGLYSDNRDYLLGDDGKIKYTKNPNGTYDLNDIPVFSWYVSGNFGGNDYTAILIGKGEE